MLNDYSDNPNGKDTGREGPTSTWVKITATITIAIAIVAAYLIIKNFSKHDKEPLKERKIESRTSLPGSQNSGLFSYKDAFGRKQVVIAPTEKGEGQIACRKKVTA